MVQSLKQRLFTAVKRRNKSVYISIYSYTIPAFGPKNPEFPGFFVSIIFTYYYYTGIMQLIVIMAIVAWFIIWTKTPVQTSKHVLTIRQQKRNRESTHKILLIYIAVILYGIRINSKIVNSVFIVLIMVAMLMIAELKFVNGLTIRQSDRYSYLKNKMVGVIVEICLFTCCVAVNTASTHWTYEAEIPRDIQRKFDNK